MRIRSLLPPDRAQLIDILSQGAGFRSEEVACAIELLDAALAPSDGAAADQRDPDDTGYEARVAVADDGERVLGYACFGATPMTEATYDLYWLVVGESARGRGVGGALVAAVDEELKQRGARIVRVDVFIAGTRQRQVLDRDRAQHRPRRRRGGRRRGATPAGRRRQRAHQRGGGQQPPERPAHHSTLAYTSRSSPCR